MKIIHAIRDQGGKMLLFESFCGGLVAPESDNNLWNYKFTWAPRNVVLAGQGGAAKFIQGGKYKYIPYPKIFRRTEFFAVEGYGKFEAYDNRDSLKYRKPRHSVRRDERAARCGSAGFGRVFTKPVDGY